MYSLCLLIRSILRRLHMGLRGLLRNVLQARREDGWVQKLVGHSAVTTSFHFTCHCPVRLRSSVERGRKDKCGEGRGVKVIKGEDQITEWLMQSLSSITTSNKCTVCSGIHSTFSFPVTLRYGYHQFHPPKKTLLPSVHLSEAFK